VSVLGGGELGEVALGEFVSGGFGLGGGELGGGELAGGELGDVAWGEFARGGFASVGFPTGGVALDDIDAAPVLRSVTLPLFATQIVVSLVPSRILMSYAAPLLPVDLVIDVIFLPLVSRCTVAFTALGNWSMVISLRSPDAGLSADGLSAAGLSGDVGAGGVWSSARTAEVMASGAVSARPRMMRASVFMASSHRDQCNACTTHRGAPQRTCAEPLLERAPAREDANGSIRGPTDW
jgi:hypothetical protein